MANGTIGVSQIDVLTTSGTGTVSIVPPATNTNRTLTLPDETGTVVTTATTTGINASALSTGTISTDRLPIVPIANGGTGSNTLTANNVILGNGTSAVQFVAPGTTGNVLTSNGTTWTSAAASSGTPTVNEYNTPVTGATWTKPASANFVLIEIWGGGGSGGRGTTSGPSGGGGGGAYNSALVKFSDLVGAVTYTVASGGASRTTAGVGNAGGTSQVDMASFQGGGTKQLFAYGGGGGGGSSTSNFDGGGGGGGGQLEVGGVGGVYNQVGRSGQRAWGGNGGGPGGGTGSWDFAITCSIFMVIPAEPGSSGGGGGGSGYGGVAPTTFNGTGSYWAGAGSIYGGGGGGGGTDTTSSTATLNPGGSSLYGGGGGGGCNAQGTGGNGGSSVWGGAGSAGTTGNTASAAGTQPAGGSGGTETANSGAGGDGRVRFTYW